MDFNQTLYKEHLEEMSALYDQRAFLTSDSRTDFANAEDVELRLEAHLDALIIGGVQALDMCTRPDDAGQLYAGISLFCIQNKTKLIKKALLDYDKKKELDAATEALCHYWVKAWDISWLFELFEQKKELLSVINKIVQYHGLTCTEKQKELLQNNRIINPDKIIDIGLYGDINDVENLISRLSQKNLADKAAIGLNLITGANLFEDVFIQENIDKDILFDHEAEKLDKGEPVYSVLQHHGINITRLCQNPETWQSWWNENKARFNPELRYRNGMPYTPLCLLDNLKSKIFPNFIRQLVHQELILNYNINVPFLTSMLVKDQHKAFNQLELIIESRKDNFKPGKWYITNE